MSSCQQFLLQVNYFLILKTHQASKLEFVLFSVYIRNQNKLYPIFKIRHFPKKIMRYQGHKSLKARPCTITRPVILSGNSHFF